jgi:hypothetical protein
VLSCRKSVQLGTAPDSAPIVECFTQARSTPEDGNIVVRAETLESALVYILHTPVVPTT